MCRSGFYLPGSLAQLRRDEVESEVCEEIFFSKNPDRATFCIEELCLFESKAL